jgi:WD40 repeat protein
LLRVSASLRLCVIFFCALACADAADYSAVQALFDKHCVDCHASQEPEAGLVMETFEAFMKGGQTGPAVVPGKSDESLTIKMVEGRIEKDGKKLIMPPGKRKKLSTEEITLIREWIDAGAKPPTEVVKKEIDVPKIEPKVPPRRAINALAYSSSNKLIAVARHAEVELVSAATRASVRTLKNHQGAVNAVAFSPDSKYLFAAAGDTAVSGEVRQWEIAEGKLVRVFEGHSDAIYAAAVSPDGKTLATGSYDQKIKLWNIETGNETKTLSGHNGGIFGLAFRPDGKLLASASADRTIKLWDVATGERRDTLSQPLKEQHAVAFSSDGKRLVAGGVDNRIRVWEISETAAETTNPLLESRFAHEGAILRIVYSPDGKTLASSADDRSVKLWDADDLKQRLRLESQPDWPTGLVLTRDNKLVVVGRLDGTLEFYDAKTGKVAPPPAPTLSQAEPRGIQRGVETHIRLIGSNLVNLTELRTSNSNLTGRVVGGEQGNEALAELKAASDLAPGPYEIWVSGSAGESGKLKIHVDSLPQVVDTPGTSQTNVILQLPVNVWAALNPMGDTDQFHFEAKAGQNIVLDLRAKAFGSKANAVLTLLDSSGKVIASNNDFDGVDPLLVAAIPADGRYAVRINELTLAGSAEHFYRLTIGELPYVTGCFPLSVPAGKETEVSLIGYNLPSGAAARVSPEKPGDTELPVDPEKFRARRSFKLVASELPEVIESEPNNDAAHATSLATPGAAGGRLWSEGTGADVDCFRFEAKKDELLIIETQAAQKGSPADTRIEILHADGKPVERVVLQGVRDTMINFRAVSSDASGARLDNWEEMELNQYLYLNGEVVKLFRMPQGPDSEMVFYTLGGKRRAYFDTSAVAHALEEPGYIVEAHPPGAKLAATGLPAVTIYYGNDDDAERKLGTDSRVYFTAPADGAYLVRVTDTRNEQGERFAYRLLVREPKPGFKVTLSPQNPTIPAGSGQEFTLAAERIDGFEGEITVNISDLPEGFTASTPLVIQAGHSEAKGTLNAALDAPKPDGTNAPMARVLATATIAGKSVTNEVKGFGTIKLGAQPKLFVMFEPHTEGETNAASTTKPYELTIGPGQSIPAMLRIKRNGHEDLVTFTVENLPHGVIVDNIGLNGVLIPKGEDHREIFLTARNWVPETDRWCYAIEAQAGKQTSVAVMLRVRKPGAKMATRPAASAASAAGGDKP